MAPRRKRAAAPAVAAAERLTPVMEGGDEEGDDFGVPASRLSKAEANQLAMHDKLTTLPEFWFDDVAFCPRSVIVIIYSTVVRA
jgi:hypothetical protein